jgi:hypothetical protein
MAAMTTTAGETTITAGETTTTAETTITAAAAMMTIGATATTTIGGEEFHSLSKSLLVVCNCLLPTLF